MRRLAILAVLAAIAYLVVTQGLPWYRGYRAARADAATVAADSARCVELATQARDAFVGEMEQFGRPPIQTDLWATALLRVGGRLTTAHDACSCASEACLTAAAALGDLRRMLDELDAFVRGKGDGLADPRGRLARVGQRLEAAGAAVGR